MVILPHTHHTLRTKQVLDINLMTQRRPSISLHRYTYPFEIILTNMVKSQFEPHLVFNNLKLELEGFQQFAQRRSAVVLQGACSKRRLYDEVCLFEKP